MPEDKTGKGKEEPKKATGLEGLVEEKDGGPAKLKKPPMTKKALEKTDLPHRIQGG